MPKFAANLTMMFTEVPFLDRFEAAARAGFKYVEYLWPYDYPAQELKAKLNLHGLKQVLFNSLPGNIAAGEWGVSAGVCLLSIGVSSTHGNPTHRVRDG